MTIRTTEQRVIFHRPFTLKSGGPYPPGEYLVLTDEEKIESLSFPVWRRVATTIHLGTGSVTQAWPIEPAELDAILAQDEEAVRLPP